MRRTLEIGVRVAEKPLSVRATRALRASNDYDWILFTSQHAVDFFVEALRRSRTPVPRAPHIGAVGPETSRALKRVGLRADLMPRRPAAVELVKAMKHISGARVLFPRSDIASADAVRALRARSARVTVVPLYTTMAEPLAASTKRMLLSGGYDSLSFKSPSGVRGLWNQLTRTERQHVTTLPAFAIGETTLTALRAAGFTKARVL